MATKSFRYFLKGIQLRGETADASDNLEGSVFVNSTTNRFKGYIEAAVREFVTTDQTQTLSNKSLVDSTTAIVDATDSTKQIKFDAAGTTNTKTTVVSSQTADRTITLPDVSGTLITTGDTGSITSGMIADGTIVNSDINASAAIDKTKLAAGTASRVEVTDVSGNLTESSVTTTELGLLSGKTGSLVTTADTGTVTSTMIADGTIVNADINASAAIARTKLASGTASTLIANDGSGVMSDISDITVGTNNFTLTNTKHLEVQAATDSTTTGSNATLTSFSGGLIRLTNSSLVSLANIPAGADGQQVILFNRTGVSVNVIDDSAAVGTAANRIYTGTSTTLAMPSNSALIFEYDATSSRWQVVGGSGGGSIFLDSSFAIVDQADNTKQLNFNVSGTTGTLTTIFTNQTANRLLTIPDATTTMVGTDYPQTLTSKTIVAANNTITTAASGNLTSTSLNSALAELQSDIDFNRAANRVFLLDNTETVSVWSSGNNATFLGGGAIAGTLADETSSPLHGTKSYKYTQAAGSLNDYFVSPAQAVDLRFRSQQVFLSFPYQYNGSTSDIRIVLYDVTNSTIITATTDVVIGTNGATSTAIVGCIIPATCTSIRVGFHIKVLNSGKVFSFDDIQLSTEIFAATNVANITDWTPYTPTFQGFGTPTSVEFEYRQVGGNYEIRGKFVSGTPTAVEARIGLPASATSAGTSVIPSIQNIGEAVRNTAQSGSFKVLIEPSVTYMTIGLWDGANAALTKRNGNDLVSASNTFAFFASVPIAGFSAYNSSIVVPNQQVSSDTLAFVFKSTAIDPNTDAIGTFNTYTYAANTNTATIATTAPTQTTSSMNINGIQVFARAYNAASTAASPARVDIFIGKGLKSKQVDAYASTSKTNKLLIDFQTVGSNSWGTNYAYDELTGILSIIAGIQTNASNTGAFVGVRADTAASLSDGYFVFNASKTPSLVTVPQLQQRVAYLSDVKTGGATSGGNSTGGVYQTRTLNTLVDPTGFVVGLASNAFTLSAGTYDIDASAPCYAGNAHKIRIRNTTDSTTALVGTKEFPATSVLSTSTLKGQITITSAKTFELQHFITTGQVEGLGISNASGGDDNIFSKVTITKIK